MSGALSTKTATPLFFFACAKKRVVFLLAIPYADGFGHRSQDSQGEGDFKDGVWFYADG